MKSFIPEIIGIVVTLTVAMISYFGGIKAAKIRSQANHPLLKTNVMIALKTFMRINSLVQQMFKETTADRFLVLGAHNGKSHLRFATAYYEQHDTRMESSEESSVLSYGAVSRYVKFEFDRFYRQILKQAEVDGVVNLIVADMPNSDLKSIYLSEGINHSKVFFLRRQVNYDGKGNDLLLYCSIAKHGLEEYLPEEKVIMRTYISQIREVLNHSFNS